MHVHNKVDPKEDAEVINLELVLADWQTVENRLANTKKKAKGLVDKQTKAEIELLEKLNTHLESGKSARSLDYTDEEALTIKDLHLLTMKPMMYVFNCEETGPAASGVPSSQRSGTPFATGLWRENKQETNFLTDSEVGVNISAKLEAELADLTAAEAREYLKASGLEQSGLDKIIVAGYKLLDLVTYFTSGEPETRAWTVKWGTKGPGAAGVIHTDFIKGYIKADVVPWPDFVACGGWAGAKEKGVLQLVGKEYEVKDGDVCYFHVSA